MTSGKNSEEPLFKDEEIDSFVFIIPSLSEEKSHPNHWYNRAADLRASAGALWHAMKHDGQQSISESLGLGHGYSLSVACRPVYHMLCGLSLEVIIKAVLAYRRAKIPEIHDLNTLAGLIGMKPTMKEKDLLKYYTSSVVWAGRYPIPKNCNDESLQTFYDDARKVLVKPQKKSATLQFLVHNDATDWENFHSLWLKISSEFKFGP